MSVWDATRYGFSPAYFLLVEGIPVVWSEVATGKSLPTGYTVEVAALSVDRSGPVGIEQIDRLTGKPATPPLSFELLDTATTRDWLRKPSAQTVLTANASATATSLSVDSSSGFTSDAWLGLEHVTISSTGAGVLNLSARGVNGQPYAHAVGTSGQIVTDRPRYWRGRAVTLYAVPVAPNGYVPGNNLLDDAREVWRGRITGGPARTQNGFAFEAEAFDRVLDRSLSDKVTGTVEARGGFALVDTGHNCTVSGNAWNTNGNLLWSIGFTFNLYDGTTYNDGDLITCVAARELFVSKFNAALIASGANTRVSEARFDALGMAGPDGGYTFFVAKLLLPKDANVAQYKVLIEFAGLKFRVEGFSLHLDSNVGQSDWMVYDVPWHPVHSKQFDGATSMSLTILVDDPKLTTVPSEGVLTIDEKVYPYTGAQLVNGRVNLVLPSNPYNTKKMIGGTAELSVVSSNTYEKLMLETLESSGTTLRGAEDNLPRGSGYGIDQDLIKLSSFQHAALADANETGRAEPSGKSFFEIYGGILGFNRLAVVSRFDPDEPFATDEQIKLTVVSTDSPSALQKVTITDADLLAHGGDPIEAVQRLMAPNSIVVRLPYGDADTEDLVIAADQASIEAEGLREAEFVIQTTDRQKYVSAAKYVSAGWFAYDQTAQAAILIVPPWIDAEVGDVVKLSGLTHPSLWTWSSNPGAVGYDGHARVVGRTLDLVNLRVRLAVIFDGQTQFRALSPSAQVKAVTTPANATSISVPPQYFPHFAACRKATGGNYYIQHYKPGQIESVNQTHRVTAEALSGGLCVLTVDNHSGGHVVQVDLSYLTLPLLDAGLVVDFQKSFAHVSDGGNWG
jgi:hypothetical protein